MRIPAISLLIHRFKVIYRPLSIASSLRTHSQLIMSCYLVSRSDKTRRVALDNRRVDLTVEELLDSPGNSSKIVRLRPNLDEEYLLVRSLDKESPLSLNGFRLFPDQAYEAISGDILFIQDSHQFTVEFPSLKRKSKEMDSPDDSKITPKTKAIKTEEAEETKFERLENGNLYMMTWKGVKPSDKIAAYDIDGTIIKTKSGRVFAKNMEDWQLAFPEIPGKLKELYKNNFKIVFLTNQSGMTVGKLKPEDFKLKLTRIIEKLNLPIQVLIAPGVNKFRKPMTGMWEYLETKANGGVSVDRTRSFYVGDAAGRPERGSTKKDHSCCDRLMAMNLNIPFFTPEEHFQCAKVFTNWIRPEFNADQLDPEAAVLSPSSASIKEDHQEMIVMVGFPGSGKSFFTKKYFGKSSEYSVVNRDQLGSWQKCVAEAERALMAKRSVVVDNTNPDLESRKRYIELGNKFKVPVRCFQMATTYKHAKHNVRFREILDPNHMKINDMVMNSYKQKFVTPTKKEGFAEIVQVNFVPDFNDDDGERKALYRTYMLDS